MVGIAGGRRLPRRINERRGAGVLAISPDLPAFLPTFSPVIHAILPALDAGRSVLLRAARDQQESDEWNDEVTRFHVGHFAELNQMGDV